MFSPILAEIVPQHLRTNIYAMDRTFEMSFAAFAPPTVGFLTEHFYGFKPRSREGKEQKSHTDLENGIALSKGLFATIAFPFIVCCAIYSFLYCTYPRDREAMEGVHNVGEIGMVPLSVHAEEMEDSALIDNSNVSKISDSSVESFLSDRENAVDGHEQL